MEPTLARESDLDEKLLELSSEIDAFEGYTYAHGLRIAAIADAIGKEFNLAAHDRFFMQQAALVHDIGEMVMNRDYIKENRILTATERLDLQRHPVIGEQDAAKRGLSRGVQLLIRWHHEWWNGTGYPDCLEGEQIPLAARILRVADSFAALRDNRPRRKAMSVAEAKAHLREWAGLEFDPKVVKAFLASTYVDLYEVEVPAQNESASQPSDDRVGQIEKTAAGSSLGSDRNTRTVPQLEKAPADDKPFRFADNNE